MKLHFDKIYTICSTPNMTMYLYGDTSYFHRSFWKKLVWLKTPCLKAANREYWTSQVFSSTPWARSPFLAAAAKKKQHKYNSENRRFNELAKATYQSLFVHLRIRYQAISSHYCLAVFWKCFPFDLWSQVHRASKIFETLVPQTEHISRWDQGQCHLFIKKNNSDKETVDLEN